MKVGDDIMENDDLKIFTGNGLSTITGITNIGAVGAQTTINTATTINVNPVDIMERYSLNEVYVEHRITAAELLAIKDTVDFKDIIKQNLTKKASEEIVNKMSFTKKHDMDSDTHAFRGRVWAFTKEELLQLIEDIKNGIR